MTPKIGSLCGPEESTNATSYRCIILNRYIQQASWFDNITDHSPSHYLSNSRKDLSAQRRIQLLLLQHTNSQKPSQGNTLGMCVFQKMLQNSFHFLTKRVLSSINIEVCKGRADQNAKQLETGCYERGNLDVGNEHGAICYYD